MDFAFISRHKPTPEQVQLAAEQGIILHHVGDADAFTVTPYWVEAHAPEVTEDFEDQDGCVRHTITIQFYGVVVVHPAAALRLCKDYLIGVFENANRAPEGAPPQFSAKAFHIYDLTY